MANPAPLVELESEEVGCVVPDLSLAPDPDTQLEMRLKSIVRLSTSNTLLLISVGKTYLYNVETETIDLEIDHWCVDRVAVSSDLEHDYFAFVSGANIHIYEFTKNLITSHRQMFPGQYFNSPRLVFGTGHEGPLLFRNSTRDHLAVVYNKDLDEVEVLTDLTYCRYVFANWPHRDGILYWTSELHDGSIIWHKNDGSEQTVLLLDGDLYEIFNYLDRYLAVVHSVEDRDIAVTLLEIEHDFRIFESIPVSLGNISYEYQIFVHYIADFGKLLVQNHDSHQFAIFDFNNCAWTYSGTSFRPLTLIGEMLLMSVSDDHIFRETIT